MVVRFTTHSMQEDAKGVSQVTRGCHGKRHDVWENLEPAPKVQNAVVLSAEPFI
jgi:hypothetical protein